MPVGMDMSAGIGSTGNGDTAGHSCSRNGVPLASEIIVHARQELVKLQAGDEVLISQPPSEAERFALP